EGTPQGIPFNLGFWTGPDGKGLVAALNPGSYAGNVAYDLSKSDPRNTARDYVDWPARIALNGKVSGLFTDYHYYGTGDVGGSPGESSVSFVEAMMTRSKLALPTKDRAAGSPANEETMGAGPLRIVSSTAEQMFLDIKPDQIAKLPHYS